MISFLYIFGAAVSLLGLASCENSTNTSSAAYAISTDGNCGGTTNETCAGSTYGNCCSKNGFCGSTDAYCGSGCQDAFGASGACQGVNSSISTTGSCGGSSGLICTGSTWGNCCSSHGYCGGNDTYCGVGCQTSWGECGSSAETNSTTTTSASASASTAASTSISTSPSKSISTAVSISISTSPSTSPFTSPSSTALSSQRKTPVTQTTGFKAGISVMAVVLGLAIIGALAFFLLRRRRRNTLHGQPGPATGAGLVKKPELDADKPLAAPAYASEAGVKPYMQPSELPVVSTPQELSADERERQRVAKVDDRAAAGYEGAYRGN